MVLEDVLRVQAYTINLLEQNFILRLYLLFNVIVFMNFFGDVFEKSFFKNGFSKKSHQKNNYMVKKFVLFSTILTLSAQKNATRPIKNWLRVIFQTKGQPRFEK